MTKDFKKYKDLAIVIAFPDNWAKGEKIRDRILYSLGITYTQYYKVGHAALLLIKKETGEVQYFDFGRYITPPKKGRVRSKDTDPKLAIHIKAEFDNEGELINLFDIMSFLESIPDATHGHGETYFSVCKNINFEYGLRYIHSLIERGNIKYITYGIGGMNCSSFVSKSLLKAIKPGRKKINLYFSETIAPTPLGNVVNASEKGNIWKLNTNRFDELKLNRLKVLKIIFDSTMLSLTKNKYLKKSINNFEPLNNHKRIEIPKKAQYLFSLGESSWMHIYKNRDCNKNEFIIESYTDNNKLNYSIIAEQEEGYLNLNIPYKFTYDCNRLRTIIIQNDTKHVFYYKKDNKLIEGQINSINNSKLFFLKTKNR